MSDHVCCGCSQSEDFAGGSDYERAAIVAYLRLDRNNGLAECRVLADEIETGEHHIALQAKP